MPDLRGQNLQDAQDAIPTLTNNEVFLTGSTDLTGQARNQMMDRNWQVCTSTPAPGESFTHTTSIDFGVVRIEPKPARDGERNENQGSRQLSASVHASRLHRVEPGET